MYLQIAPTDLCTYSIQKLSNSPVRNKLWIKSHAINSVGDPNVPPSDNLDLGSVRSPIVITDPGRFVPKITPYSGVGLFTARFT